MVTEDPSPPIPYARDPYPSTVNEAMSETMMVPVVLKAEETVPCICDPAPRSGIRTRGAMRRRSDGQEKILTPPPARFSGRGKDSDKSFLLLTIKIRCQDICGLCQIRMTFRKILGLHGPDPCRDLSGKRSSAITSYPFYPTVAMPHPIERHMPYRRPRISQTKDDRNEDRQDHRGIV